MYAVKNILLDLGGVIYDVEPHNVVSSLEEYGVTGLDIFNGRAEVSAVEEFERGMTSAASFRNWMRNKTGLNLPDDAIDGIVNSMLVDIPQNRIELLMALKQRYKVILYSNTNEIHYRYFTDLMLRKYSCDIFSTCFHACYFSHILRMRKPDTAGFEAIIRKEKLLPAETLFIDDNRANIEAANSVGIRGYWLHDKQLTDLFDENLSPILEARRG